MPRAPKPVNIRQNRERRDLGVITGGLAQEIPRPPTGLLKKSRDTWYRFWESNLATSAAFKKETDLGVVENLWRLYDERERAWKTHRKARYVQGSTGQMVVNPAGKMALQIDSQILALEDRLGLSPMARLKLGITFGQAQMSLEELIRRQNEAAAADEDDPRDDELEDQGEQHG